MSEVKKTRPISKGVSKGPIKKKVVKKLTSKKTVKKKAVKKVVSKKSIKKVAPISVKKKTNTTQKKSEKSEKTKTIMLRNRLNMAILSPFRLPLDVERLAIQSARIGGLAFVLVGAFFTMYNLQFFMSGSTAPVHSKYLAANIITTGIDDTSRDGTTDSTSEGGLKTVEEPDCTQTDSNDCFGTADDPILQTDDTSDETNTSTETTSSSHDSTDTTADTSTETDSGSHDSGTSNATEDKVPVADVYIPNSDSLIGLSELYLKVVDADAVAFHALSKVDGNVHALGHAKEISTGKWLLEWDTSQHQDGTYVIEAQIENRYGVYESESVYVQLINESTHTAKTVESDADVTEESTEAVDTIDSNVDTTENSVIDTDEEIDMIDSVETDSSEEQDQISEIPLILNFYIPENISDETHIFVNAPKANSLEFYAERKLASTPHFLGLARQKDDGNWLFKWDTTNSPNGQYRVYVQTKVDNKIIRSEYKEVAIYNKTELENQDISTIIVVDTVEDVQKTIAEVTDEVAADDAYDNSKIVEEHEQEREISDSTKELFVTYKDVIDDEFEKLASAIRAGDETQVVLVKERIETMREEIIQTTVDGGDMDEVISKVEDKFKEEIKVQQERVEKTEKIVKERVGIAVTRDSDNDGITDFDETTIYDTDPHVADSDGDGFSDGAEILNGFNPTDESPEAIIEYESPQESGFVRKDVFVVNSVTKVISDEKNNVVQKNEALIEGRALPNSFVTLYIFSTPVIVTVKTEADGSWAYTFDKELEDGKHEVYVGITDNAGKIVAKSEPLSFIKTAQAFTPVASGEEVVVAQTAPKKDTLLENVILIVMSISVVIVGLVLLLLGMHLHTRREQRISLGTPDYSPNPAV